MQTDELLDGMQLAGEEAGVGSGATRRLGTGRPAAHSRGVIVSSTKKSMSSSIQTNGLRVALDRPADGQELQLGKLMFCL